MFDHETFARQATVVDQLCDAYRVFAPQPALRYDNGWLSFGELGELTYRAAAVLIDCGAVLGDRVISCLPNSAVLRIFENAVMQSGLVRVGLSPRLHDREIAAIAEDCGARIVICEPDRASSLRSTLAERELETQVVAASDDGGGHTPASIARLERTHPPARDEIAADDVAMLMYSSGTTGRPKGAIVTHGAWVAQTEGALAILPHIGPGDVVLQVAPMTHFGGSIGIDCAVRGAATVTQNRFEPGAVLAAIEEHAVTVLPLAPVMLRRLVDAMEEANSGPLALRALPYGGSPTPAPTLRAAVRLFPGALTQFYGLAEALAPLASLSAAEHTAAAGSSAQGASGDIASERLESIGRFADGIEVRIENAEILVRGATVMPGYWNRDELSARVRNEDGWFATGDLASIDEEGYVHLLARASEVIISGGFNVYPAEVERVVATVAGIREVVVLGLPDARWGETVVAVVVLEAERASRPPSLGTRELLAQIHDACAGQLAGYKKPTSVHIVAELPRNAAGKVIRNEVRRLLSSAKKGSHHAGT